MARTPRLFINERIYEICFRTEEGLPLVCTPYMDTILRGILAEAFSRYRATLLSFIVMGNHMHLHIRVDNPEHVDDVICYIKRESAHAINNLLGRTRRTVWQEGYDAVLILDAEKMIDRLAYIYLNVARAELESSIDAYPGLSGWRMMLGTETTLSGRRIPREKIPALPERNISLTEQACFATQLLDDALPQNDIVVDPMAFLDSFPGAEHLDREKVREKIIQKIHFEEARLAAKRSRPVHGAHALRLSSMRKTFTPKKFGKKMWCFGSTKEVRLHCINWFKEQLSIIADLRARLCRRDFLESLPPGFFAPGGYLRANLVSAALPF